MEQLIINFVLVMVTILTDTAMHNDIPMIHCERRGTGTEYGRREGQSMKPCQPANRQHQWNRSNSLEQAAHLYSDHFNIRTCQCKLSERELSGSLAYLSL